MEPIVCLFDLIKLDMQQIQNYRIAIISVSISIIVASFAITTFVCKEKNVIVSENRSKTLILSNLIMLLLLIITTVYYADGLDFSRKTQEIREKHLKEYVDSKGTMAIISTMLYPKKKKWRTTSFSLHRSWKNSHYT